MPTSGISTFQVTRDDIIFAAYRACGLYTFNDLGPSANATTYAAQALNILVKNLMQDGYMLHCYKTISLAQVANKNPYTIGPSGADWTADRPERVAQAWMRDANNNDRPVNVLTRQQYNMLTPKNASGPIINVYYDPQIVSGVLYVWNVPTDTSETIFLSVQRPIFDLVNSTDNFDMPQEGFALLKWCLADELRIELGTPARIQAEIEKKAQFYRTSLADWLTAEEPVTYFTPDPQAQLGAGSGGSGVV